MEIGFMWILALGCRVYNKGNYRDFAFPSQPPDPHMIAKEIKPGTVVNYNAAPVLIESVSVQSPSARGAATLYKFRARNLITRQKIDITLKGADSLDDANFERRNVKFMYADATDWHFLDQTDYNQYSLPAEDIAEERKYLTEHLEGVLALIYNDRCVGLQLPTTVELTITECEPGIKGNSATSRSKPATLETGAIVQVPEYLSQGETIKIDTRTGQYLSRA
jgi:elongation factor P